MVDRVYKDTGFWMPVPGKKSFSTANLLEAW